MLHGYPIEATADNWLHQTLCDVLKSIHERCGDGAISLDWPDIIPEARREYLRKRPGLETRLERYRGAVSALSEEEREGIAHALYSQNQIESLLTCRSECPAIEDLPETVREPIKDLFRFAFGLLGPCGLRRKHYAVIYARMPTRMCPFCGCEGFAGPSAPKEALDHYLAESRYPFAAANLRNLVPMGSRCNSAYKGASDILRHKDGRRRRAFDPYGGHETTISLGSSTLRATPPLIEWRVDIEPESEEVATWDEIFDIRHRYVSDVLEPSFNQWVGAFGRLFRQRFGPIVSSDEQLLSALERHVDELQNMGLAGREFLRAPMFRLLHQLCSYGSESVRLREFLRNVIDRPA